MKKLGAFFKDVNDKYERDEHGFLKSYICLDDE